MIMKIESPSNAQICCRMAHQICHKPYNILLIQANNLEDVEESTQQILNSRFSFDCSQAYNKLFRRKHASMSISSIIPT